MSEENKPKYCYQCGKNLTWCTCVKKPARSSITTNCPKCKKEIHGSDTYCCWCKTNLKNERESNYDFLIKCKDELDADHVWCPRCEAKISVDAGVCPECWLGLNPVYKTNKSFREVCQSKRPQANEVTSDDSDKRVAQSFCVKCGASLPEGAKFCGACREPVSGISKTRKEINTLGLTGTGIAARAFAVLALVFMFMPWVNVPAMYQYEYWLGTGSNGITSNFAMYQLDSFGSSLLGLYGIDVFGGYKTLFFIVWIIALLMLAGGLLRSFMGDKSTRLLMAAGVVVALLATVWFITIHCVDVYYSRDILNLYGANTSVMKCTFSVYGTIISGILLEVLSVTKGKAA